MASLVKPFSFIPSISIGGNMNRKPIVFFLLLFTATIFAGNLPPNSKLDDLNNYIEKGMKEWQIPGMAVAIIENGEVVFQNGYGVKDLKTKEPVTTQTLFSLASVTKSFTATLGVMLLDENILCLDTPVKEFFPEFDLYDDVTEENVTFRDFLCHRSGLGRYDFYRANAPKDRSRLMEDLKYLEQTRDFRDLFAYSNIGYAIAGDLMAQKAGSTWEELIQKKILNPLDMKGTLFSTEEMQKSADYAKPHIDWGEGETIEIGFHNANTIEAAGGLVSNAEDLAKWVIFNINKGQVENTKLLSPRFFRQLESPHVSIARRSPYSEKLYPQYALGRFVESYRGNLHVHHGGVLFGFTSHIAWLPDKKIGVVILANKNGTRFVNALEGEILDRMLGVEPADWNGRFLANQKRTDEYFRNLAAQPDTIKQNGTILSHKEEAYLGKYKSKGYGEIEIIQEGEEFKAILTTERCRLTRYHYDIFELYNAERDRTWMLNFLTNIEGNIDSFEIEPEPGMKKVVFEKI